jgi:hypothetical protein
LRSPGISSFIASPIAAGPAGASPSTTDDKETIDRTPFDIPYLKNASQVRFYTTVGEAIERDMSLGTDKRVPRSDFLNWKVSLNSKKSHTMLGKR